MQGHPEVGAKSLRRQGKIDRRCAKGGPMERGLAQLSFVVPNNDVPAPESTRSDFGNQSSNSRRTRPAPSPTAKPTTVPRHLDRRPSQRRVHPRPLAARQPRRAAAPPASARRRPVAPQASPSPARIASTATARNLPSASAGCRRRRNYAETPRQGSAG